MVTWILAIALIASSEVPDNNTFIQEYEPAFVKKMHKKKTSMQKNMEKKKTALEKSACASFLDPIECDVLARINSVRTTNGLAALIPAEKCTQLAHAHTQYMVSLSNKGAPLQKALNHDRFAERVGQYGLSGGKASENVAAGTHLMPEQVVAMWLKSSGHKQNIMDGSVLYTGLSAIKDGQGNVFWTQCFSSKK